MKISGIDKDFEDIIYYLDSKGFKPFASCDGVEANHKNVGEAYISFLKSPRIIDLISEFLKDEENFEVILKSEDHFKPHELYGNTISGTIYTVCFSNRIGEKTHYFESVIRRIVEKGATVQSNEKRKLDMLEEVLEENSNSDLAFQLSFNREYPPNMRKQGRINELTITTKLGYGKIDGDTIIQTERDMDALANILSEKYNINEMPDNAEEYPKTEFIMQRFAKCSCSIYFTDEHFTQILEQIQYITQIAHTLPTFESREWIGSDEELFDEYYDERWDIDDEQDMTDGFDNTPLSIREERLTKLEREAEKLSRAEQQISKLDQKNDERI